MKEKKKCRSYYEGFKQIGSKPRTKWNLMMLSSWQGQLTIFDLCSLNPNSSVRRWRKGFCPPFPWSWPCSLWTRWGAAWVWEWAFKSKMTWKTWSCSSWDCRSWNGGRIRINCWWNQPSWKFWCWRSPRTWNKTYCWKSHRNSWRCKCSIHRWQNLLWHHLQKWTQCKRRMELMSQILACVDFNVSS